MNCELENLKHAFLVCLGELPIERLLEDKTLINNIYLIDHTFSELQKTIQKRKEITC